jgi:putative ABC transport system permease protein
MRLPAGRVRTALPAPRGRIAASWGAVTGTGAAASAALAILVLACTFMAVAVPRASLGYRTQVVQQVFRAASAQQKAVLADADLAGLEQASLSAGQLAFARSKLADGLRSAGLPLAPAASQWSGLAISAGAVSGAPRPAAQHMLPPQLELLYRSGLSRNATLVAGSLPTRAQGHATSATFQVAVTAATAAGLGLRVGSRLRAAGQVLVVSGIIRPLGVGSSFWTVEPSAAAPRLTYPSLNSAPYLGTAAFVGAAELPQLERYLGGQPLRALWSFPLGLGHVSADQAAGLLRALEGVAYLPAVTLVSTKLGVITGATSPLVMNLSSGLVTALSPFVAADDAVQRALSLLFVSLAAIAAVVVLLGARLVAEHRWGEFDLMRARGASLAQVAMVALAGGSAAALPAAAVAVAAAALATPGPESWLSWWLAGLITVAALAGPPVLAAWQHRARRDTTRAAPAAGTRRKIAAARRWVGDGALVCAAVGGLVILRQQGLPPPGSMDLFTSLAPVLAAIPVALLVIRCYPLVLRQLTRLAARRRGVVMVIGLARGSAATWAAVLPAFALILAFAVAAFAAMARDAVARADVAASWQAVAADAVVTAPATGPGITPAAQRLITGVPGARHTTMVSVTTGTSGQGLPLPVVIVDPRQYAALSAATPAPPFPAAALARPGAGGAARTGPVPALISPAARTSLGPGSTLQVAARHLRLRVAGAVASIVGGPAGSQFVVLPRWALPNQAPQPTVIAIAGPGLDTAALARTVRHAVPGARVTLRSHLLAAISRAPLPHGGLVTLAQGAVAAGAFSLLILLLMLVLSARSREMTLARLVTMGLGAAQSRRIAAVEALPLILAAAVGGTVCALALVPLVGPAVDLAAFTGRPVNVQLRADLLAIAAAAGGLLLLAGVTLAVQDRLARRRGTSQALRVGE